MSLSAIVSSETSFIRECSLKYSLSIEVSSGFNDSINKLSYDYDDVTQDFVLIIVATEIGTEGENAYQYRPFLFSTIDQQIENDLNNCIVSPELINNFLNNGIQLSQNINIQKLQNDFWKIIENNNITYEIWKENGMLKIYKKSPFPAIVVKSKNEQYYYRVWAHEIGHASGRLIHSSKRFREQDMLWDLYPNGIIKIQNGVTIKNAGEVSNIWELMAYGDNLPPPHFSSMSKVLLGWMVPKLILRGETVKMYAIEQGIYGENAFIHYGLNDVQYVIEAREKPKNKVVIYKLEDYDLINDLVMPTAKNTVSISNMNEYYDLNNFVYFKVSEESTNPYSVKVTITDPTLTQRIKGVVLDTKTLLLPTTLPLLNGCLNKPNYTFPDIDLHVVSPDGKHVGVNYTSGLYENEIHGALSSGDLINDKEWIFVPSDINVAYYISSHEVQKFLEENPDINVTNASIEYSITFMEYGLNPKLIELPDGNWTVQNRTSSEPQIDIIEPGEMKEIILPDIITLTTITNLSSTNGTLWINWTWTNPSDPDFNHTEIYLNSLHQTNTSTTFFNATSLTPNTEYTISTRTVDTSGILRHRRSGDHLQCQRFL